MLFITWVPTNVNLPKLLQSTTRIVSGGQYISCSGNSMSRNLTVVLKLGFRLAFMMTDDWIMWPAHSTSTRGLSTVIHWILLRPRNPQNSTSNLQKVYTYKSYFAKIGRPVFNILICVRVYCFLRRTCKWLVSVEFPQVLVKLAPSRPLEGHLICLPLSDQEMVVSPGCRYHLAKRIKYHSVLFTYNNFCPSVIKYSITYVFVAEAYLKHFKST